MTTYKRELYLSKIRPFIDTESVKVLTGIRRSGKSVIVELLIGELTAMGKDPDNILKIDLESKSIPALKTDDDLYRYIVDWASGKDRAYIFLDEIQNVDGWQKCIRSLIVDIDADIYLTGSSSKLLSGELATHISGRYVEIPIRPFSFREITEIEQSKEDPRDKKELFDLFVRYGGMPLVVMNDYDTSRIISILGAMYDSVIMNDIAERKNIRNTGVLKEVLGYAMSEIGHGISSTNVSNYMKSQKKNASIDTILEYLESAEDAMFIKKAPRQDVRGKDVMKIDYKYYLTDVGIREVKGMSNTASIDQVLENIVFNELCVRGYTVTVGRNGTSEIDFVADKGPVREYYQVTYLLATDDVVKREFGAFEGTPDYYPKYVLSMDDVDRSMNGISHRNIIDWLLE